MLPSIIVTFLCAISTHPLSRSRTILSLDHQISRKNLGGFPISDDLYKPVELSSDEKAALVKKNATCPFIGSAIGEDKLSVLNDVEDPVASIEEIRRLGNSGGGVTLLDQPLQGNPSHHSICCQFTDKLAIMELGECLPEVIQFVFGRGKARRFRFQGDRPHVLALTRTHSRSALGWVGQPFSPRIKTEVAW